MEKKERDTKLISIARGSVGGVWIYFSQIVAATASELLERSLSSVPKSVVVGEEKGSSEKRGIFSLKCPHRSSPLVNRPAPKIRKLPASIRHVPLSRKAIGAQEEEPRVPVLLEVGDELGLGPGQVRSRLGQILTD